MDVEEISGAIASEDPAVGLRAALALRRLAERVEASQVESAREKGLVLAAGRRGAGRHPPIGARQVRKGQVRKGRAVSSRVVHAPGDARRRW